MAIKLLGEKTVNVDSKGRIRVPNSFVLDNNTQLAIMETGKSYFNIYPLCKIQKFIKILEDKRNGLSFEEKREIRNQIRRVYSLIIDTYYMDESRRVLLPKKLRETISGKSVVLEGVNTHISVCPNQEAYDNFCLRYTPENYGIKKL